MIKRVIQFVVCIVAALTVVPIAQAVKAEFPQGEPPEVDTEKLGFDYRIHGYYRVRANYINNIDLQPDGIENTGYIEQRLRLEPGLWFGENLGFFMQLHAFDNVIWGYNYGINGPAGYSNYEKYEPATDLFASGETNTLASGLETDSLRWERAWVEWLTPVGILVVGRNSSHFGMGINSHHGGNALGLFRKDMTTEQVYDRYFMNYFDDANSGSSYDQIIFGTLPLVPFGISEEEVPLFMFLQYTKLSDIGGKTTRKNNGIHITKDDTDEYLIGMYYEGGDPDPSVDIVEGGFYFEERANVQSKSEVYILEYYWKLRMSHFYLENDGVMVRGRSRKNGIDFTQKAEANIFMTIGRIGYETDTFDARLEVGYTPGDDGLYHPDAPKTLAIPYTRDENDDGLPDTDEDGNIILDSDGNQKVTTFYALQDYKVGLIMFPTLYNYFSTGWLDVSGIINSTYIYPTLDLRLMDRKLRLIFAGLYAQSNEPEQFRGLVDDETDLGLEFDFRLDYTIWDHIHIGFETGYLFPGKGFPGYYAGYEETGEVEDPDNVFLFRGRFTLVW